MSKTFTPTENGIATLCERDAQEVKNILASVPLADTPASLDAGEWDSKPVVALSLVVQWSKNTRDENNDIRIWPWLVAHQRAGELEMNHGECVFRSEVSPVVMQLSEKLIRLALASNIEGALIGEYGSVQGEKNATAFYQAMLSVEPTKAMRLTAWGRDVLFELHESFAQAVMQDELAPEVRH